jgi:hypothetical protein
VLGFETHEDGAKHRRDFDDIVVLLSWDCPTDASRIPCFPSLCLGSQVRFSCSLRARDRSSPPGYSTNANSPAPRCYATSNCDQIFRSMVVTTTIVRSHADTRCSTRRGADAPAPTRKLHGHVLGAGTIRHAPVSVRKFPPPPFQSVPRNNNPPLQLPCRSRGLG